MKVSSLLICCFVVVLLATAVAAPPQDAAVPAGISTKARVEVKDMHRKPIALKPEEQIALMFMEAISDLEDACRSDAHHLCTLEELIARPKSADGWRIGKLKYDPAVDTNYKYVITINGDKWTATASPQRKGLGSFLCNGGLYDISRTYYNSKGPASTHNKMLGDIDIDGDSFKAW